MLESLVFRKNDLNNQIIFLWEESLIIEKASKQEIKTIFIAYKDRFIRFRYDEFETFLQKQGTEILIAKNEELSPQQELVADLVSIIHVFSCRIYGLRKYNEKIQGDDEVEKGL